MVFSRAAFPPPWVALFPVAARDYFMGRTFSLDCCEADLATFDEAGGRGALGGKERVSDAGRSLRNVVLGGSFQILHVRLQVA